MLLQFANGRPTLPSPTVAVASGGTTTVSRTLYFALQGLNASGYNLLSSVVGPFTVAAGQQATITLPSTVHAPGEFFSDYVISASASNTPSTFVQVARIPAFNSGGAAIALPTSLALTTDGQLTLSAIVANPAALPTTSLVLGMRRGVSSLAYVFEYDSANLQTADGTTVLTASPAPGNWVRVGGFSTVVTDTTAPGGCAQDVRSLAVGSIAVRPYNCSGQNGPRQRFWMVNDSTDALPAGQRVMLSVSVNQAPASDLFEGMLRVIFRGYVTISDGSVRTITAAGDNMRGVDQEIIFQNKKTDLILEDDLQPGEAYAIDVYPNLRPEFLGNQVANKSLIQVSIGLALQSGSYVEGGSAMGDRMFPEFDKGLVVPQRIGLKILKRSGMVNSRAFMGIAASPIVGAQLNADQFIYINSNGSAYFKAGAQVSTEDIRAKVSTLAGVSNPSAWSTPITVSASGALNITCTYPSNGTTGTVRANYPDLLLAGNSQGQFNCQLVTLYIRSTVGGTPTIKAFAGKLVVDGATQVFQVSDWTAGTVISSLPAAPSASFCLFDPVLASVVASGVGSIPSGAIDVAFAYQFDGSQISSISHDPINGCLPTSSLSYAAVEQASQYWAQAVDTIASLRNIALSNVIAYQTRYVGAVNNPYRYDPASTAVDDSYRVVKPTAKGLSDPGRWILDDSNAIFILTAPPTIATAGGIGDIAIVINPGSTDNGKVYQKTSFTVWTLTGTISGATGAAGSSIYSVTAAPISTLGQVGDSAIVANNASPDNGKLYQKTSPTVWTLQGSFIGPTGLTGATGASVYSVTAAPISTLGQVGDSAIVANNASSDNGKLYQKTSPTVWTLQGSLLGPTGAPGTVSAAGGLVIESTATLSTTATQVALRNASGVLKVQTASNGIELTVATLEQPQTYLKAQRSVVVALTYAVTIAVDANLSNLYTVILSGNCTLETPTNLQAGTNFEVQITQDATGARTLAYGTAYKFAGGTVPVLTAAAGAVDRLSCVSYDGTTLRCDLGKGYA